MGVGIINTNTKKMITSEDIDKELRIGTTIERKEHGFILRISRKIARDHIKEFLKYNKLYYTDKVYGLIVNERKLKKR